MFQYTPYRISKRSVPVVQPQFIAREEIVGNINIGPEIVIEIADNNTKSISVPFYARFPGHINKMRMILPFFNSFILIELIVGRRITARIPGMQYIRIGTL